MQRGKRHDPGSHRLRIACRCAAIALAAHVAIVTPFVARGSPAWFLHLGEGSSVLPFARAVLGPSVPVPHIDGHDGAQFWMLARDPFLSNPGRLIASLDRPVYRAQRIGYPALAAPWSVGGEGALLWGMIATNLGVVFVGTIAAALLALELSAPARASVAFALNPAVVASVLLDVADALSVAGIVVCLLALRRRSTAGAVAGAVVAVLAKETALLSVLGVAVLGPGLSRWLRVRVVVASAAAVVAWGAYVRSRLGFTWLGAKEFTIPFTGYAQAVCGVWWPLRDWQNAVVALAVLGGAAFAVLRFARRRNLLTSAALPFAILPPFFAAGVIEIALNPVRAVAPAVTLVLLDVYVEAAPRDAAPAVAEPL